MGARQMVNDISVSYAAASAFFIDQVRTVDHADWNRPGLGDWTIIELVGHGNRGHTLITEFVERPIDRASLPADYFTDEAVAARGRAAAAALGDDPLSAVEASAAKALRIIEDASPDATVGTSSGTMLLADYVPSRTAELAIHGLDLARALRRQASLPSEAAVATLHFLAELATRRNKSAEVILGLTGRERLPASFSLY